MASKAKVGEPAGQKRKQDEEIEVPSPSKAKVEEPAGQKRKQNEEIGGPSPSKAKVGEPTGEKRKAEEALEDLEEKDGPRSPTKPKLDDNEEMDDEVIMRGPMYISACRQDRRVRITIRVRGG